MYELDNTQARAIPCIVHHHKGQCNSTIYYDFIQTKSIGTKTLLFIEKGHGGS